MKNPVDPFENINLDNFKNQDTKTKHSTENKKLLDKETIKDVARESDFQSRERIRDKSKVVTKTFSLFQEECTIIDTILKNCLNHQGNSLTQPSGSDIVRAALHAFTQKTSQEQITMIFNHRGRGRK